MSTPKPCRKCLVSALSNSTVQQTVARSIAEISQNEKTDEKDYQKRLSICLSCDNLLSGTCLSCGCYVEIRAAIKRGRCPDKKW